VSRITDGTLPGADHARARELAATRLDEPLPPADAAWLGAHLATCEACSAVAAGYDLGRSALRALRDASPEPPRDLWARTAAALETEQARGARRSGWFGRRRRPDRWSRVGRIVAAPLVGLVVVALVVESGLLGGAAPGDPGAMATPIALTAAADLRVLTRSSDGTVSLVSGQMKSVCPIGSESCGVAPSFAVTPVAGITTTSDLGAVLSPTQDRMVVVSGQNGSQRVVIFPVVMGALVASPSPSARPTPSHGPSATPTPTVAAAPTRAGGTVTPTTPATVAPTPTPATTATTAAGSPAPTSTSPAATSPAPTDGPVAASASPSIAVSPVPGGAIQIASNVTVVGAVVYSPDGRQVAFAAVPSDGSAGPDIYVWTAGDGAAHALTTDHATQLAGWTAAGILAGRVVGGKPSTELLDPSSGMVTPLQGQAWMPVVNPAGTAAAWWDGTVKLAADGVTWVPDTGRLVLGAWPPASTPSASAAPSDPASTDASATGSASASAAPVPVSPAAAGLASTGASGSPSASAGPSAAGPQVIADGPIDGWQARWDEGGTLLAIWLHQGNAEQPGRLSLYPIDPATGLAVLAHPLLDSAPAAQGISLRSGRLVWSGPGASGRDAVQVLAWNGTEVGRLELPADQGATVVP
jgi:hypothetical protein